MKKPSFFMVERLAMGEGKRSGSAGVLCSPERRQALLGLDPVGVAGEKHGFSRVERPGKHAGAGSWTGKTGPNRGHSTRARDGTHQLGRERFIR